MHGYRFLSNAGRLLLYTIAISIRGLYFARGILHRWAATLISTLVFIALDAVDRERTETGPMRRKLSTLNLYEHKLEFIALVSTLYSTGFYRL